MIPAPGLVLEGLAQQLATRFPRDLRSPYAQHDALLAGTLLTVLAQQVDGLADRLRRENEAVGAILTDAMPVLPTDLANQVTSCLEQPPTDIRVSSLQLQNDRLRTLLIHVHACIEEHESPAARDLDERIWEEYRESTRRRHVEFPL